MRAHKEPCHPGRLPGGSLSLLGQILKLVLQQKPKVGTWEGEALRPAALGEQATAGIHLFIFLFHPGGPFPHQIQPTQHLPSPPTV